MKIESEGEVTRQGQEQSERNGVEDNDEMEEEGRPESTDRGHDVLLRAAAAATFKG